MVEMSDLCSCCLRTTSSNFITSPSSKLIDWNFAQVKKYQMNAYQEIILSFSLSASKIASGIQVSLVKPLLSGSISTHSPCLGVHVSGQPYDTTTPTITSPPWPSELLPLPAMLFFKGHQLKKLHKTSSCFWEKKKNREKILSPLKKLIYLFFFCKEKNVETRKEKGFKGSPEMQIVSFSKLS